MPKWKNFIMPTDCKICEMYKKLTMVSVKDISLLVYVKVKIRPQCRRWLSIFERTRCPFFSVLSFERIVSV
jgi:hypothetical protein